MEITINIQGLEVIASAINNMAEALKTSKVQTVSNLAPIPVMQKAMEQDVSANQNMTVQQSSQPAIQAQIPTQQPINTYTQTQPTSATNQQTTIQTATTSYTLDNLSAAAMTLLDTGRQPDLLNLLAQFGVESLPALPQEQYGAFATALRGLGAQI
ncbi:hypothetical protein C8E03_11946 [Lachnotalea glycerini]|uniref:Uncharacterized protein n=1 Tax=Lachnotalea glycerini TaxID=1763509 RepID=A0A318EM70_9FIRM|nr:hypothetical protein [Lachnotalea glycerini]PXV85122.1 hypothetical protein C8E03_11946 [Lachnotalea glycerini]